MFFCPAHHVRKRGRQLKEHGIRRTAWGGVLGMGFCLSVCVCVSVFGFVWVCVCYCFLQPPQAQFHWFCFGTACLGVTGGGRSFWASGCARKSKGGGTHTHSLQGLFCFNAGMVSTSYCLIWQKCRNMKKYRRSPWRIPKSKTATRTQQLC